MAIQVIFWLNSSPHAACVTGVLMLTGLEGAAAAGKSGGSAGCCAEVANSPITLPRSDGLLPDGLNSFMAAALNPDCSLGSNPSQPPLVRGEAECALPLSRGSWRGSGSKGLFGLNVSTNPLPLLIVPSAFGSAVSNTDALAAICVFSTACVPSSGRGVTAGFCCASKAASMSAGGELAITGGAVAALSCSLDCLAVSPDGGGLDSAGLAESATWRASILPKPCPSGWAMSSLPDGLLAAALAGVLLMLMGRSVMV